jgi:hypothetical protein
MQTREPGSERSASATDEFQKLTYFVTLLASGAAAILLIAPTAYRQVLFRLVADRGAYDRLAALPPLRPAAFFCCVVPPWLLSLLLAEPEPDFLPPRLEAPSELEMAAARLLLMPFLRRPSYCLSFLTLEP